MSSHGAYFHREDNKKMATITICDITGERINEEKPKKLLVGYYADDNEESTIHYEVSDEIYELFKWVWDSPDNIKALFTSIKKRKAGLEKKGNING